LRKDGGNVGVLDTSTSRVAAVFNEGTTAKMRAHDQNVTGFDAVERL
jgi:hypothetical protein